MGKHRKRLQQGENTSSIIIKTTFPVKNYQSGVMSDSQALAIQNRLIVERWRLFTTSFVLAETHALLLNRLSQHIATAFLRNLEQGTTTLVWVTRADVQHANAIIYQYDDKDFSLTDATSFAVMEPLRISYAFIFDHHFTQYGLTVLTAS